MKTGDFQESIQTDLYKQREDLQKLSATVLRGEIYWKIAFGVLAFLGISGVALFSLFMKAKSEVSLLQTRIGVSDSKLKQSEKEAVQRVEAEFERLIESAAEEILPQLKIAHGFRYDTPSPKFSWGKQFTRAATVGFEVYEPKSMVFFQTDVAVWGSGEECTAAIRLVFDEKIDITTLKVMDVPPTSSGNNHGILVASSMREFSQGKHSVALEVAGCSFIKTPHLNVITLGN